MKVLLFTLLIFSISVAQMNKQSLMPYPKSISTTESNFKLDKNFTVQYSNVGVRINKLANRFLMRLANRTGIFFENPIAKEINNETNPSLLISIVRSGDIAVNEDESYELNVTEKYVHLEANTDIGAIRGIETLLQLLNADEEGYYFPGIKINDSPRFPWRGLLIDVCRHFMPVNVIKRNLDAMAAVKMNVLHWHLSEDQGFRVESKTFPKLHELGSNGDYYTQEQIKDIINYAGNLGIRVIPEFDIPGHATSWLVAYPELASAPGPYEIEKYYGIKDPTFNPAIEETYEFFDEFFKEMSQLFPDDYIHIGGDENNGRQWDKNESIQQFMKKNNFKDNHELQAYFNNRILKILTKYNKKMVGWDEIFHEDIPNTIVIQSWRGKEALIEAAKKGYNGILSNGYYIDLMQPTEYHYLNDPIIKNANLTKEEEEKILGGEATMWSEWVTPENIDSRIWPRTAAIAERLWSSREINDVDDMFTRLDKVSLLLEDLGLQHISYQEKMLRRLTNGEDTKHLKILVDVLEPLQEYKRGMDAKKNGMEFSQYTPFTRIIDASNVDTKIVINFKNLVKKYLAEKDNSSLQEIKAYLTKWKDNHEKLLPIIKRSPMLKEMKQMSENLSLLAEMTLTLISSNKKENVQISEVRKILSQSRISYGQVEMAIVDSIEELLTSITVN